MILNRIDRPSRCFSLSARPVATIRPPLPGDYVFVTPTTVNSVAMIAWVTVPNLQFFWLLDAVTQNRPIPPPYIVLVTIYGIAQIGVFLSLAVLLFQKRDVG